MILIAHTPQTSTANEPSSTGTFEVLVQKQRQSILQTAQDLVRIAKRFPAHH